MAHILEEFAKVCGTKPSKPQLSEHFFPITFPRYIVMGCGTTEQSMTYPYWREVFELVRLHLDIQGIKIIQLNQNNYAPIPGVDLTLEGISLQQIAYVIKNSLAVVSPSGLLTHMASAYDKPSVSLHAKYFSTTSSPYWTNGDICLNPPSDKIKPCFTDKDPFHLIKTILPETIAQGIFSILNINTTTNHESLHVGAQYPNEIAEVCPNFFNPGLLNPTQPLNLRLDWHHGVEAAIHWSQNRKVNLFFDTPIDIQHLSMIKPSINQLNFFITKETDINYITQLQSAGIKFKLFQKGADNIDDTRLKFIDWIVDEHTPPTKKDLDNSEKICDNTHYKSSKIIISNNQVYASRAAMLKNIPKETEEAKIIDCPEFWEDLNHYYIFNK